MYLQVQYQQIVDASEPDQASASPIPANCRCFQPRPGICSSNTSKLQMLPRPEFTPICIYKSNTSKLQILPTPGYVSTSPILANCRCFQPRPGICKSNSSKLQILPTPTRHLQIQIQQVADTSDPRIGIYKSNTSKLQMLPTPTRHLQIHIQQIADTSNPDQASATPQNNKSKMPTGEFSSQIRRWASLFHLYCIFISSNSYIYLFLIHRGLSLPVSWHLFWTFPVFHRFPYALLWESLPTRPLLPLSVPDGFCPR